MPRAVTAHGGGRTDLAVLESAVSWCYGANVSVSWGCKVVSNSAIQGAAAPGCLCEANPREFLADEHLPAELVRDTSSAFSDLLEMRACILNHPVAVGETKHVRPARA